MDFGHDATLRFLVTDHMRFLLAATQAETIESANLTLWEQLRMYEPHVDDLYRVLKETAEKDDCDLPANLVSAFEGFVRESTKYCVAHCKEPVAPTKEEGKEEEDKEEDKEEDEEAEKEEEKREEEEGDICCHIDISKNA
jgi:hypothetical protein